MIDKIQQEDSTKEIFRNERECKNETREKNKFTFTSCPPDLTCVFNAHY